MEPLLSLQSIQAILNRSDVYILDERLETAKTKSQKNPIKCKEKEKKRFDTHTV